MQTLQSKSDPVLMARLIVSLADIRFLAFFTSKGRKPMPLALAKCNKIWRDEVRKHVRECPTLREAVQTLRAVRQLRGW